MKIKDIYDFLDNLSPFDTQEKWDNSGLIVGSFDDSFKKVYISLDLDLALVKKIKKNSLIITHHPLIFSPLKKINDDSYSTKILKQLIKKDIKLISMHTNIDKSHLNNYVGNTILGFDFRKVGEFILEAKVDMSFKKLKQHIKDKLNLKILKTTKIKKHINTLALTTGSGMSLLPYIKADCFITGDIKYHEAMEANARQINLVDIGHYESEIYFCDILEDSTREYFKKNNIESKILNTKNPFQQEH
jgi:dinuclear metal center YbgI/SA1388 family protein